MTIVTNNQSGSTEITFTVGEVIVGIKFVVLVTLLISNLTAKK